MYRLPCGIVGIRGEHSGMRVVNWMQGVVGIVGEDFREELRLRECDHGQVRVVALDLRHAHRRSLE